MTQHIERYQLLKTFRVQIIKLKHGPKGDIEVSRILESSTGAFQYRRWAGKTSYVHFAPEHEYRTKHLMKAHKN